MRLLILTGLMGVLAGCTEVRSIEPLHAPDTLVFDPALLGVWKEDDGPGLYVVREGRDRSYEIFVTSTENESAQRYRGHLVRLAGEWFLDVTDAGNTGFAVPAYGFARVRSRGDEMEVAFLETEYLRKEVIPKSGLSRFSVEKTVILTAPTADLVDWVRRQAADPRCFAEPLKLIRTR